MDAILRIAWGCLFVTGATAHELSGDAMQKKILIMGLPGAGKTTLSKELAPRLNAVHFNADEVRAHVNKDLGYSEVDRIEQAARMGWLCDQVVKVGGYAIADFICPTPKTRDAFLRGGEAFVIFVDRIQTGAFPDTNRMFMRPERYDLRVTADGSPEYWAEQAMMRAAPGIRSEEAHGTIRRPLPTVPRWPPRTNRRRAQACGTGLYRGPCDGGDRRQEPVPFRIRQIPHRTRPARI